MRKGIRRKICLLAAAAVVTAGLWVPVPVLGADAGITVTTREEFMEALKQPGSHIMVQGLITIGKETDTDQRMLPVKIPAGTTIEGTAGSNLNCRSPVQLEGDNVVFRNIKLTFESSNALGSVPHREIFLAGHSLTMDNVRTYLEGGADAIGGFGGTEKELLPIVYAGGYTGTVNGENASFTLQNSNEETMFQGIFMGHGAGSDRKSPYKGNAQVKLDGKAIVREPIDSSENSWASVEVIGGQYGTKAIKYHGNENTTLTLRQGIMEEASVEDIGNLVIENGSCLGTTTGTLQNVILKNGGCLDLTKAPNPVIAGNFTGVSDSLENQGLLVLNQNLSEALRIQGTVTGITKFQTYHRLFPGTLLPGRQYIIADPAKAARGNFVLPEKNLENGYRLNYREGAWIPCWEEDYEEPSEEEKPPVTPPEEEKPEITPPVMPPEEEKPEITPPVTPPEEEKPEITPPVTPPGEEKPEITPPAVPPEEEKPEETPPALPPEEETLPGNGKPSVTPAAHVHRYIPVFEKATTEKDGARMKRCSCGKISEQQSIYRIQDVKLLTERMVYSGRSRKPELKVIDRTGKVIDRSQYQVSYQNNVNVGQGKAIIRFRDNYSGSLEKKFFIEPERTSLTGLKARSKGFTVRWKKQAAQTAGYEIQYSASSRFSKKTTRTITVKNRKTTSKTIAKQKPGKKYYVRIRAYQPVKIEGRTVRMYSKWSKVKSVKTKK